MTDFRARALDSLDAARYRTLALTDCLDDEQLLAQHSPLMSPLVWDLAHVGNFEDVYLVRGLAGLPAVRPDLDGLYDAFEHPRAERPRLPLLSPDEARSYIADVRARTVEIVNEHDLGEHERRLIAFVAQHEHQHDETMLATHQLRKGRAVLNADRPEPAEAADLPAEAVVEAGPFLMGADTDWSLDNERPVHEVDVAAFGIDTAPVTNEAFGEFIADGGYEDPRWWSPEGWKHRQDAGFVAPLFWRADGDGWTRRRFGHDEPVPPDQPVMHVSWYEADAYARWAGRRLPTEAEWEKAAAWDPEEGRSLRLPWDGEDTGRDRANLDLRHLEPAPAGSFPAGAAPSGARQMLGDVWEWTASDFAAYPGFRAHPDPTYSEVFFDGRYKVLRGGSFATHPDAARCSFRNWDLPVRRQIFCGFRTARDA